MKALAGAGLGVVAFTALAGRPPRPRLDADTDGRVLFGAMLTAAGEELLWRGLLLRRARRSLGDRRALTLTAAGFAAAHGRRASCAHLLLGGGLGALALTPAGVVGAVAAHAVYNTLVLLEDPP